MLICCLGKATWSLKRADPGLTDQCPPPRLDDISADVAPSGEADSPGEAVM